MLSRSYGIEDNSTMLPEHTLTLGTARPILVVY